MTNPVKYGVISDVHQDPRIVPLAIQVLKQQGAEKLIVNGDIGSHQRTLEDSQNYTAFILDSIGKSGIESYVQPGSHETIGAYAPVIEHFCSKYPNLIDVIKNQKVQQNGHDLVFLPGSDFLCGGEYQIGNDPTLSTHNYIGIKKPKTIILPDKSLKVIGVDRSLVMFDSLEEGISSLNGMQKIDPNASFELFRYTNMNNLSKLVTSPETTVVVCHVPRKFDNLETCVDVAEFGEAMDTFHMWEVGCVDSQTKRLMTHGLFQDNLKKYFQEQGVQRIINGETIHEGSIYPLQIARQVIAQFPEIPVKIKKENRGNQDLRNLYEKLGITKAVSGHFHESGHRANDSKGNPVQENQPVNELFWNTGHLDIGQTGILTVEGDKVSYRNILLQDFLK